MIVNPVAGTDAAVGALKAISAGLRRAFEIVDIALTVAEGDAVGLGRTAAVEGYDQVTVVGGDGTLNETLNGVGQVPGALERTVFSIVPMGTGNDLATALGIPADLDAAIDVATRGRQRSIDVAQLDDVYFVNASAGGFIAEVSDAVTPAMKTLAGRFAYLLGGAQVLLDYSPSRAYIVPRAVDPAFPIEGPIDLPLHTFAVCNSSSIGGGRRIAPLAQLDDGWLDVVLVEGMSTVDFVGILGQIAAGDHLSDERVRFFRARELEVSFDRVVAVNTDGQVRELDRCAYRLIPSALRVLVPGNQR